MRVVKFLSIKAIEVKSFSITPQTFDLASKISDGVLTPEDLPPIKVHLRGCRYILTDGRHRITALKLLGHENIKAKFFKEEKEEI